MMSKDKLFDEL